MEEVKREIKEWRAALYQISMFEGVSEKYRKRIEGLKHIKTRNAEREIARLEGICDSFRLKELRERESAFRERYQPYIDKLAPVEGLIIKDFVSGASQSEISQDLGYSEVGIRKRLDRIYKKLASALKTE